MSQQTPSGTRAAVRAIVILIIVAGCAWMVLKPRKAPGPAPGPKGLREFTGRTMGTAYAVKVMVDPERWPKVARHVMPAIQAQLDLVDERMSTYRPDSELSRFNQSTETTPFRISPETLEVFRIAQAVSEASGGAFDVTVGPLVNAWGFGPEEGRQEGPSEAELAALRERVGYRNLEIDEAALTIRKALPDIYCDLGAVAKGYAVDRVAQALDRLEIHNYMVEVGGEIRTRGSKAGEPWRIGIEEPVTGRRAIRKVLKMPVAGLAMATSGDYRNYIEIGGVRLSHTIDPRTSRPIAHGLASASVLHDTCAMADAYATALMVLGPEKGYTLAVEHGLAALFIIREAPDRFAEKATPAFKQLSAVN